MQLRFTETAGHRVAEIVSAGTVISTAQDALDLIGTTGYEGASHILLNENQLAPEFFDLRTGLAGEILQKLVNYRMNLIIIGAFEELESESLRAFINEANRGTQLAFVTSKAAALARLAD